MRLANPVEGRDALALKDPVRQIIAIVGQDSTVIQGRKGALVVLEDAALGRDDAMVPLIAGSPSGAETARASLMRFAGDVPVEEWWHNSSTGIEQGFTVGSRLEGAGPVRLRQTINSALSARIIDWGRGVLFADDHGKRLRFSGLKAFDAIGRDLPARMEVESDYLTFEVDDRSAVYPIVIDPIWSQPTYLKASNADADDEFGWSVAVDGDTVAVGAPLEDSNATVVNGDQSNDAATSAGAVYVFTRTAGVWSQQAYLKATGARTGDRFGWSVAISGDTLVVGAPYEDSNATGVNGDESNIAAPQSGAAYVFTRTAGVWSQEAYLKASNTGIDDGFGIRVAASGDTVVVSAPLEDSNAIGVDGDQSNDVATNAGAAYVFARTAGVWSQQAYLKASNTDLADYFGDSVSVSGDTVVVGAYFEDSGATGVNGDGSDNSASGSGAAYVFTRSAGVWSQQAYLKASNSGAGDRFGSAVVIDGDLLVVGATLEDSNATGVDGDQSNDVATNAGAAYVFARTAGVWSQQTYLKASNTEDFDQFGFTVALSGDTIAVGAPVESSNATGVNGDESDNSATDAGAVYVFTRTAGVWLQQAYLKASNSGTDDSLGRTLSMSGDIIVSGAHYEDGSSTGVDGPDDDTLRDAGAAYVWSLTPPATSTTTTTVPLTPTTTAAPSATITTSSTPQTVEPSPGVLPETGQGALQLLWLALVLLALGAVVMLSENRHRRNGRVGGGITEH